MNEPVVADKASEWRRLKALVLDSVSSPITWRVSTWVWANSSPGLSRNRGRPDLRKRPSVLASYIGTAWPVVRVGQRPDNGST
jgi:hypothetical protein